MGRGLRRALIADLVEHGARKKPDHVAGVIVTRAITGHVTREMTEHYGHVDRAEKLRAADQVVALAGLRGSANDNAVAPLTRRPSGADLSPSGGEVKIQPPSRGSGGGLD